MNSFVFAEFQYQYQILSVIHSDPFCPIRVPCIHLGGFVLNMTSKIEFYT